MNRTTTTARSALPRGLVGLLAAATLLAGCGDDGSGGPPPDGTGDGAAGAVAPPTDAHAPSTRPSPDWFDRPRATWPRLVARHDADLRTFGTLEGGAGFLGRDASGALLAVTARHWVTPEAGLTGEIELAYFEPFVRRWELVSDSGRARIGGRARSGCDAPGSELLLLEATVADGAAPPSTPLVLSDRVPEIGEALVVADADGTIFDVRLEAYAAGAALALELDTAPDPDRLLGAVVLDSNGHAVACIGAIADGARDSTAADATGAATTRVRAQVLRPFLRAPAPLRGIPVAFDNNGFERFDLDPTGALAFMGNPMLGGAILVEWPSARRFEGPALPEGQGVGAFTDSGWLVTAGRGGNFAVFDTLTRATLVDGRCSLLLVTSLLVLDERRVLLGSAFADEVALCDLATGAPLETLAVGGASMARSADGRWLALGSGEGAVQIVDVSGRTVGTAFGERRVLAAHDDQVTALAFDREGRWLASGGWDGVVRVTDVSSGATLWESANRSEVNDLLFDADGRLFVATGSIEDVDDPEPDGDGRAPIDCYVRVFDGGDGRELLRSHDHTTPVVALSTELAPKARDEDATSEGSDPTATHVLGITIGSNHFRWDVPR